MAEKWIAKGESNWLPAHIVEDDARARLVAEVYGPSKDDRQTRTNMMAAAPELKAALEDVMGLFDNGDVAYLWSKKGEQAAHSAAVNKARYP